MREHRECNSFLRVGIDAEFRGGGDAATGEKSFELRHKLCVVHAAARRDYFLRIRREALNAGGNGGRGENGGGGDEIRNGEPGREERFDELPAVLLAARGLRGPRCVIRMAEELIEKRTIAVVFRRDTAVTVEGPAAFGEQGH